MRHFSAQVLASAFIAASLIVSSGSCGESPAKSLAQTENSYADLMDASSIMAAIDSGLFASFRGKDRAAWKQIQQEKYKEVTSRLGKITEKDLSATDARAFMLIRKSVESIAADQITPAHKVHCNDAHTRDLKIADLHSALYDCFEERSEEHTSAPVTR